MADFKITKIIEKKINREKLSVEEINYLVKAVVKSTEPCADVFKEHLMDRAQIGAVLMAIYFNGLCNEELMELTISMKNSGYVFSWPHEWRHLVVDKHSTGGVGDKVSLVLAPALAAVGLKVPMISGRSLGHTGGTLDKLESIPGFRALLTKEEIKDIVGTVGCCIVGQTEDCVPADKILYQCREITSTVTCPPLIVASIASKKLSEGTNALVYDVKYGSGSVFSSKEEALATAKKLVEFSGGTKASALLTSMEKPLGRAIGNSLEVLEAIECLKSPGQNDIIQLTCALGGELLHSVNNITRSEGENLILESLKDGRALQKFHDMIHNQGVSAKVAYDLCFTNNAIEILPKAQYKKPILYSGEDGYIREIDPYILATVWKEECCESRQHPGVGITLNKDVGDKIQKGEAWAYLHYNSCNLFEKLYSQLTKAITVGKTRKQVILIDRQISLEDVLQEGSA